jgi:hypothetical protein
MHYGNEEVFARFCDAVLTRAKPEGIGAEAAQNVLIMQHQLMSEARRLW